MLTVSRAANAPRISWMRVISLGRLLTSQVLLTRPDALPEFERAKLFKLSEPAEHCAFFFSHSWGSPGYKKQLSLTWYSMGINAIVFGIIGVVLLLLFEEYVCELPGIAFEDHIVGVRFEVSSAYFLGLITTWVYLLLGPLLQGRSRGFLDGVCVHQVDAFLKSQGVCDVPNYIRESQEFFAAVDEVYFSRGWCVYELSIALHEKKPIRCLPLNMYTVMTVEYLYYSISVLGYIFTYPWLVNFADPGLCLALFCNWLICGTFDAVAADLLVQQQGRLRKQLSTFEVRNVAFAHLEDRARVLESTKLLYGDLDTFDALVRTKVRTWAVDVFERQRAVLPYCMALVCSIPQMFMLLESGLSLRNQSVELQLAYLMFVLNVVFCSFPTASAICMMLGKSCDAQVANLSIPVNLCHVRASVAGGSYATIANYLPFKVCGIASGKLDWVGDPWQAVTAQLVLLFLSAVITTVIFLPRDTWRGKQKSSFNDISARPLLHETDAGRFPS